jgi:hypothetical protein
VKEEKKKKGRYFKKEETSPVNEKEVHCMSKPKRMAT